MKTITLFNALPRILKTYCKVAWKRSGTPLIYPEPRRSFFMFSWMMILSIGLNAQSSECVPGSVENDGDDLWSEECYLSTICEEQGNPCQASDVVLLGVFIGDENGGPVGTCADGESISFLLWGKFFNNTSTNRYAVRTCTEVWLNGSYAHQINNCSFDDLAPGTSQVALLSELEYLCNQGPQLLNTWVGWSTSASQCGDSNAPNYNSECGQYPPSKCSKGLVFIDFLVPNFSLECGPNTSSAGTEVAFTNLSEGGTAPLTYRWDFGDGTTSVSNHPVHTFSATTGIYHVLLTVTDALGVEASAQVFLDLDSLACCGLEIACLPQDGGIFSCRDEIPSADEDLIVVSEACGPVTIDVEETSSGSGCSGDTLFVTRSYLVSDGEESITCTQVFRVIDSTIPVLTCPPAISVECSSLVPAPDPGDLYVIDNCDSAPEVSFTGDDIISQSCSNRLQINRTYEAVDACGNTDVCTQIIIVYDDTPPSIDCPEGLTVSCADDIPDAESEAVVTSDGCGGNITVTVATDQISTVLCDHSFTVTRVFTATDACGNTATCAQIILVDDSVAPTISCPGDLTVSCSDEVPLPDVNAIIAIDNCSGEMEVTVQQDVITGFVCDHEYFIERVYIATDVCGNSASCVQNITVQDASSPQLVCPADMTVTCVAEVPDVDLNSILPVDNCGPGGQVSVLPDQITGQVCDNQYTIIRVYVATDGCGNTSSCSQSIVVRDDVAPTITCPANFTVTCASEIPVVNLDLITVSDNCAGPVTAALFSDVITSQVCANNFTRIRTFIATDACGNTSTCSQAILVFDDIAPTLTCPDNITVVCADDIPVPDPDALLTSDNCGESVSVVHVSDVIADVSCPNQWTIIRTYLATDGCGNSTSCTQQITVDDTEAPVIAFTHPLLEGAAHGDTIEVQCYGQDPHWDLPAFDANSISALDQCDEPAIVEFTQSIEAEGNCREDGFIHIQRLSWTAEDSCGNSSAAFIFLSLIDTIPPVIEGVPEDITVSPDEIPEPPEVFALDECLCACLVLMEQTPLSEGCMDGQVIVRSWRATDDCGNATEVQQLITIEDNEGPELALLVPELSELHDGAVMDYHCIDGGLPLFYELLDASSMNTSDFSQPVEIDFSIQTDRPANCDYFGYLEQHTFTWLAVDGCGNTTSMTLQAELDDDVVPQILGVPEVTCFDSPLLANIEAVDNCGDVRFIHWDVEIPNPCGEGTALRRTYEATDQCGNMTRDTAFLLPDDGVVPILEFINPVLAASRPGEPIQISCLASKGQLTPFSSDDVIAHDGCQEGLEVVFNENILSEGSCADRGTLALVELQWIATDHCGHRVVKTVLAEVIDDVPPVIVDHEREITIKCNQPLPEILAVDNCGDVVIETRDSVVLSICENQYDLLRSIKVTDACGNVTTDRQWVHVTSAGPEISGVEEEVCNDLSMPAVSALDPCTGKRVDVDMTEDTLHNVCREGMVVRRTWLATDACGNVTEIVQHIIMNDFSAPQITVPQQSIIRKFDDAQGISHVLLSQRDIIEALDVLNAFSVFALDDCDEEIIPDFAVQVIVPENIAEAGYAEERIYTWTARDICGNASVLSFTVFIIDDMPPEVGEFPGDTTIVCGSLPPVPGMLSADPSDPVDVIYTETIEAGSNTGEFIVIRTWVLIDQAGNETTVVQRILWIPETLLSCSIVLPEQVDCNSHGVIIRSDLEEGVAPFTYIWEIEGDECFIQSGQNTPEISIYVGWTDVNIRLTVIDKFGCSTSCDAVLSCDLTLSGFNTHDQNHADAVENGQEITASAETLRRMNLWPNPANEIAELSFETKEAYPVKYTIYDFLGREVMNEMIHATKGRNSYDLDISSLPEGTYWLTTATSDESVTRKLIIMRN